MEEEINFDMTVILNSYNLNGNVDNMYWTGYPLIEFIDLSIIKDKKILQKFGNRLVFLEEKIKEYRILLKKYKNKQAEESDLMMIEGEIYDNNVILNELFMKYCNKEYFIVALIKTYYIIKSKCPEEIKSIQNTSGMKVIRKIKELELIANQWDDLMKFERPNDDESMSNIILFLTPKAEEKISFKKNNEKLRKILKFFPESNEENKTKEECILEELNLVLVANDMCEFFSSEELAKSLNIAVYFDYLFTLTNYEQDKGASKSVDGTPLMFDRYISMGQKQIIEVAINEYQYQKYQDDYEPQFITNYILKYIKYVDLDKLFLLYMYRHFEVLESIKINLQDENSINEDGEFDQIDDSEAVEYLGLESYIEASDEAKSILNKILKTNQIDSASKIKIKDNYITVKDIREKMKLFVGRFYFTPSIEEYIKFKIYMNSDDKELYNEEVLKKIKWTEADIEFLLVTNNQFLKSVIEYNLVDKVLLEKVLEKISKNKIDKLSCIQDKNWNEVYIDKINNTVLPDSKTFVKRLKEFNIIDEVDLKRYYMNGYIGLDDLNQQNSDRLKELVDDVELLESYKKYIEYMLSLSDNPSDAEKEKLAEFKLNKEKNFLYYKKFMIDGLTKEEKDDLALTIMTNYLELFEDKDENFYLNSLREMYRDNFISFENIDSFGEKYLEKVVIEMMLKRGELSLGDTIKLKSMIDDDTIIDIVESAMEDPSINDDEKFILIMNLFCEVNDEDELRRIEYLKRFKFSNKISKNVGGGVISPNNISNFNNNPRNNYRKLVYEDNIRWIFFNNLDSGVRVKKYINGYVEFFSPKFGVRIIEKYYEVSSRNNSVIGYAYGVATHMINEDKYASVVNQIIKIDRNTGREYVDESALKKIVPKQDRIAHCKTGSNNWMKSILRYLSIDYNSKTNSNYSQEEFNNLKSIIKNYSQQYIEI